MTPWHEFTAEEQALTEAVFTARALLREVDTRSRPQEPWVSFGELYRQAIQPDQALAPRVQQALREQKGLREDFQRLLEKTALYHLPRAAAASTGPVTLREVEGFRIRLLPSRAQPDQVFVMIELPEGFAVAPQSLLILETGGNCQKHPLPAPQDGRIQLLTESASDLAEGIRSHQAEIFLQ